LTKKELKVRYKNTYLGYLWSLLNPLALTAVLFFAFRLVMRVPVENYALFVLLGLFPWQWFANSVSASTGVFVANASLVKKTAFPRELLVFSVVLNDLFHFLCSLPIILGLLRAHGRMPGLAELLWLPALITCQGLMVAGASLLVASTNLFFRDLERLVAVGINLLFYLTPIVYPEALIPPAFQPYVFISPMAPLVVAYRSVFLGNGVSWWVFLGAVGYAGTVFAVGYGVFARLRWRFAEVL
jgi:lipopolysaccharide transport system permease protein